MSAIVLPVPKAVFLCDDLVLDQASQKVHLLGVFNAIRPAGSGGFPYTLGQLCVVVQLIGGVGDISAHVEVLNANTDEVMYTSPEHVLQFAGRQTTVSACFRIRNCTFPHAGVYLIELYCQDTFVDDRALYLLQEKGAKS